MIDPRTGKSYSPANELLLARAEKIRLQNVAAVEQMLTRKDVIRMITKWRRDLNRSLRTNYYEYSFPTVDRHVEKLLAELKPKPREKQ